MSFTIPFKKSFLPCLFVLLSACSQAQLRFTVTSSRENNYCNGTCTLFDNPDINGNSAAIIFVTPIEGKGISHPLSVYYINKKWAVINADNIAMEAGSQFNVEYYSKPDDNHFVHVVSRENSVKDRRSYLDHAGLNNNPAAQIQIFQNWSPGVWGGNINRNEVKAQYDADAGKWYIYNANDKQLEFPVAYNIMISGGDKTVEAPIKVKPDILIKEPKTVIQPVDNTTVINNPVSEKVIAPGKVLQKAYDFSNIHICVEMPPPGNVPPKGVNPVPPLPKIKSNGELETVSSVTQALSGVTNLMWYPGETITVGFLSDADFIVVNRLKIYVKEWETYANIKFQFIDNVNNAMIKVGFENDGTDWSLVGRSVLAASNGFKTMNLGSLDRSTNETELRRVVLHQFGHVLGFIDENQAPTAGIPWDRDKVFAFFEAPPRNWTSGKVNEQIFTQYAATKTNSSAYDRLSIMHYYFPPGLTTDGSSFTKNTTLSETDKAFAKQVYPFPYTPTSTGVLKTGDDCDEIEFTVEYNVVHFSEIQFILKPGIAPNGNLITWWKKIAVPIKGGTEAGLEMQDGHSATRSVLATSIDKSKGIAFGKAKALGVHTGLGFTWNVLPALLGGCRVTLVWRRDGCGGL